MRKVYGSEYPSAIHWQGERMALKHEGPFQRVYTNSNGALGMHISRFMDGSATTTLWQLQLNWWRWNRLHRIEFCNACAWLDTNPEFPKILRFLMYVGDHTVCSAIAVLVAETLPKNEAFALLLRALKRTSENSANIAQAIAQTRHPDARQTLQDHLNALWQRPSLWDDDGFNNWLAYDATCCIARLIESGASPATFESKVRLLAEHACAGNRESCTVCLHSYYPWLLGSGEPASNK